MGIIISIHAVLWDRDRARGTKEGGLEHFNPRGPLGPRLGIGRDVSRSHDISIHAVLWDRDLEDNK